MTLIAPSAEMPSAEALPAGLRLLPVGAHLWRLVDATGRALGNIQQLGSDDLPRFAARRFHAPSAMFRDLGGFCRLSEAVECLRLSR